MKRLYVKTEALIVGMFKSRVGTAVLRVTKGEEPARKRWLFCDHPKPRKASPVERKMETRAAFLRTQGQRKVYHSGGTTNSHKSLF